MALPPPTRNHIVDRLIEERAPTLFASPLGRVAMRRALYPCLGYQDSIDAVDRVVDLPGAEVMAEGVRVLQVDLGTIGLHRFPTQGRVIVVPNHPTGLPDGVAVWEALRRVRDDLRILANGDAIRLAQGLADLIIPVEWVRARRNPGATRRVLADVAAAMREERSVVLFPAGRIAYMTWRGLRERPWMPTVVNLARKFDAPILPLHIRARNSWMFYFLSQLSTELRDVTLFHELLNKRGRRFELTFGDLIDAADLPDDPQEAVSLLQRHVEDELPRASRQRPRITGARKLARTRLPVG